jgi:beta-glucosidase
LRPAVQAFADYTDVVTRRLGDRVKQWTTHNEPWVVGFLGYLYGEHAPGKKEGWKSALQVIHHLLVSHGAASQVIRANVPDAQVGIVTNHAWVDAVSDSPQDLAAKSRMEGHHNRWFLDPLFKGQYPADMLEAYEDDAPTIADGDMALTSVPLDYLGINYYTRALVKAGTEAPLFIETVRGENDHTDQDWEVYPDGLYCLLKWIDAEYHPTKIFITENGAAYDDVKSPDGTVDDVPRERYLRLHFAAAHRAMTEGVPLAGYFVWSLLDNFEWAWGYAKRFGIVYVDFETCERTVKRSGAFVRDVIRNNGF